MQFLAQSLNCSNELHSSDLSLSTTAVCSTDVSRVVISTKQYMMSFLNQVH